MMEREKIYSALFNKVKNIQGIRTASRKLKHWDNVPKGETPAIFQIQQKENATQSRGMPTVWNFSVMLYVYVNTQDGIPSVILNGIIDNIEEAFKPNADGVQDLGGLVSHCWIGGIETYEGLLGDIEIAMIPIDIKVANQNFG